MPIQHIAELFVFEGQEFVTETYRCLLRREPDKHGLAYYLGRLAMGYEKTAVIAQLAQSPECEPLDEIKGLKKLIADERRAQHWFWGLFAKRQRIERDLQRDAHVIALQQQSISLQEALNQQTQTIGLIARQIEISAQRIVNVQTSTSGQGQTHTHTDTARLSADTVRQQFITILGRAPESETVIKHHAKLPSVQALRESLLNSEEFQTRVRGLSEYARSILVRQIQKLTTSQGA